MNTHHGQTEAAKIVMQVYEHATMNHLNRVYHVSGCLLVFLLDVNFFRRRLNHHHHRCPNRPSNANE